MRVMGEEHFLDIDVRDAIEAGVIAGPRLLVAGRGLAANNGHGRALASYDGVDEVRRGARENLRRGANHVKIFVTGGVSSPGAMSTSSAYTREEIRAAVEEAHRAGTYAAAHAHGGCWSSSSRSSASVSRRTMPCWPGRAGAPKPVGSRTRSGPWRRENAPT